MMRLNSGGSVEMALTNVGKKSVGSDTTSDQSGLANPEDGWVGGSGGTAFLPEIAIGRCRGSVTRDEPFGDARGVVVKRALGGD